MTTPNKKELQDRITTIRQLLRALQAEVGEQNQLTHRQRNRKLRDILNLFSTWDEIDQKNVSPPSEDNELAEDEIPF